MISVPINKQCFGLQYDYQGEVTAFMFHDRADLQKLIHILKETDENVCRMNN